MSFDRLKNCDSVNHDVLIDRPLAVSIVAGNSNHARRLITQYLRKVWYSSLSTCDCFWPIVDI